MSPGASPTLPTPPTTRPAILSPGLDLLTAGGLSLLILVPLLVTGRGDLLLVSVGVQAWLTALINMPHFLASYRMVYRSRESVQQHPWAAVRVPVLLFLACVGAVVAARWTDAPISALLTVQNGYLAWHYTGQAWGMTAAYAHVGGVQFSPLERRLLRGSFRLLLVWHVVWFFRLAYDAWVPAELYDAVTLLMAVAFALGVGGFGMYRLRTDRFPPLRALVPWFAILAWYGAMARWGLPALFVVQMAHAVQYLGFPIRVELNRSRRLLQPSSPSPLSSPSARLAIYLVLLLAASIIAAIALPLGAMAVVTGWLGSRPGQVVGFAILAFLNIHHYFTDGVVWKLREARVREDLFGHLNPARSRRP